MSEGYDHWHDDVPDSRADAEAEYDLHGYDLDDADDDQRDRDERDRIADADDLSTT